MGWKQLSAEAMAAFRMTLQRIKAWIQAIPLGGYIGWTLQVIGLFANMIAILTFFGAINTPVTSQNFYINSQEFLVWSLIASVYAFGFISAKIKRRWRRLFGAKYGFPFPFSFLYSSYPWRMLWCEFSFTLVASFLPVFLYTRSVNAAMTNGSASPWSSLFSAMSLAVPIALGLMVISSLFDFALSLYSGDERADGD